MLKSFLSSLLCLFVLISCSKEDSQEQTINLPETTVSENEIYSYDIKNLPQTCKYPSQMVCAVELAVKCSINPSTQECQQHKKELPSFIFMEDESLQRPTEMTFRIYKLKPLKSGSVEVYTESTCNGNWFGLCQGNIIYVLTPNGDKWNVNDIYAIAAPEKQK